MSDSWLDKLPGTAKQKQNAKYKMSARAYEKLRQKVVGPEKAKQEMQTEPEFQAAFKQQIEKDIAQQGIEAVLSNPDISNEMKQQIESGSFDIDVTSPSEDVPDQLVIKPEGNVGEKMPLSKSLTESYLSQL